MRRRPCCGRSLLVARHSDLRQLVALQLVGVVLHLLHLTVLLLLPFTHSSNQLLQLLDAVCQPADGTVTVLAIHCERTSGVDDIALLIESPNTPSPLADGDLSDRSPQHALQIHPLADLSREGHWDGCKIVGPVPNEASGAAEHGFVHCHVRKLDTERGIVGRCGTRPDHVAGVDVLQSALRVLCLVGLQPGGDLVLQEDTDIPQLLVA
mmetsp:Transcript_6203/g.11516  ORF Transcript_6203/g.11516 Transcript_6203/m.11516 type:complete len:209 (+) Transcript_6203:2024-2650(+)